DVEDLVGGIVADAIALEVRKDAIPPDLVELVDGAVDRRRLVRRNAGDRRQRLEKLAVVDVDDGATEADLLQGIGQDVDGFSVGERRVGTDDIGVALPELAEPATLRLLGPPDGSDVIPLEGH